MRWREGLGRPNQAKTRSIIAMLCECGFSNVELVAVIPILGILAAVAAPKSFKANAVGGPQRHAAAAAFPQTVIENGNRLS